MSLLARGCEGCMTLGGGELHAKVASKAIVVAAFVSKE